MRFAFFAYWEPRSHNVYYTLISSRPGVARGGFMTQSSIYQDIAKRTGGDIYIGVVGPVRTGKSTFIQRFLECVVLPNIQNEFDRARTLDQTPQSATGKTIMTTEPKFVPDESVKISVDGGASLNVKLIDCVGYMVDGALGAEEDGSARLVSTPWVDEPIPFPDAAELGTQKVISLHSTIAFLVTTDGTVADIPREAYVPAEERAARELTALGKPFAIILNSKTPNSDAARALAAELETKYSAPTALVSARDMNGEDIREILNLTLGEFPIREMSFTLPEWTVALPDGHPLYSSIIDEIKDFSDSITKISDIERALSDRKWLSLPKIDAGEGRALFDIPISREVFYKTMSEISGIDVSGDRELFSIFSALADTKRKYDKVARALSDVEEKGYGIVMPDPSEMLLDEPKLVKSAGGYGVKVSARAQSIHMIRAGIKTEFSPVVGTEEQTEEVVSYLTREFEDDPKKLWESNMFGKSLYDMLRDGLDAKLLNIPDDSREKLGETLERILNEGASGLICILL